MLFQKCYRFFSIVLTKNCFRALTRLDLVEKNNIRLIQLKIPIIQNIPNDPHCKTNKRGQNIVLPSFAYLLTFSFFDCWFRKYCEAFLHCLHTLVHFSFRRRLGCVFSCGDSLLMKRILKKTLKSKIFHRLKSQSSKECTQNKYLRMSKIE